MDYYTTVENHFCKDYSMMSRDVHVVYSFVPSFSLSALVGMQQDPNFLLKKKNPSEKAVSMIQQTSNWERKEESLNEGNEKKETNQRAEPRGQSVTCGLIGGRWEEVVALVTAGLGLGQQITVRDCGLSRG